MDSAKISNCIFKKKNVKLENLEFIYNWVIFIHVGNCQKHYQSQVKKSWNTLQIFKLAIDGMFTVLFNHITFFWKTEKFYIENLHWQFSYIILKYIDAVFSRVWTLVQNLAPKLIFRWASYHFKA